MIKGRKGLHNNITNKSLNMIKVFFLADQFANQLQKIQNFIYTPRPIYHINIQLPQIFCFLFNIQIVSQ